jgi:hypothetical protein
LRRTLKSYHPASATAAAIPPSMTKKIIASPVQLPP